MPNLPLVPSDYAKYLPELKQRAFKWKMEYSSQTDLGTTGYITHYSVNGDKKGPISIILAPGLASNSDTEPLMQLVTYWALSMKYDLYALTTFINDFQPQVSSELAERHTIPEFITVMQAGLKIIEPHTTGQCTCLVGHSAGATGALEILNRRAVAKKPPLGLSAAVLFAPYVTRSAFEYIKSLYQHRHQVTDAEFESSPMGLVSPHDLFAHKSARYVSVYPRFLDDMDTLQFNPNAMSKYDIPITFVAGGKDRKSPPEMLRAMCDELKSMPNGHLFKYVEFKDSKHSFINQHTDYLAIIKLIKSLRRRKNRGLEK